MLWRRYSADTFAGHLSSVSTKSNVEASEWMCESTTLGDGRQSTVATWRSQRHGAGNSAGSPRTATIFCGALIFTVSRRFCWCAGQLLLLHPGVQALPVAGNDATHGMLLAPLLSPAPVPISELAARKRHQRGSSVSETTETWCGRGEAPSRTQWLVNPFKIKRNGRTKNRCVSAVSHKSWHVATFFAPCWWAGCR